MFAKQLVIFPTETVYGIGANALAIPNNTIIVTDELVELAKNDDEIIGVLAHEQGHLVQRHSLQQALSSLGFSVILLAITGDSSDLVTTLPAALIGAKYSSQHLIFNHRTDTHVGVNLWCVIKW